MRNGSPFAATFLLALITGAATVIAGPLTPPVGPVAPTGKTTQEVFDKVVAAEPRIAINATNTPGDNDASPSLFKITQPGSYYLTGNITGVSGKHGIEITASGVTVDLNGFDLNGVAGSLDGISVTVAFMANIEIRNGSVRNWGGDGIDAGSLNIIGGIVRDVRSYNNTGNGIYVGNGATISGCVASSNDANGVSTGVGCTIIGCTSYLNTIDGIVVTNGCTISACTVYNNSGNGINAPTGSTISECTARFNGLDGIRVNLRCVILSSNCTSNGFIGDGAGIRATGGGNRIEGNNCSNADRGISVDAAGNIIIRNTSSGNTTNWVIAANNVVGPILDRTAPASAAISGNSAPDSTGSTHPNANFTY